MDKKTLRRADLITSIVFFLFATFVFLLSVGLMKKTFERGNDWFMSAGLVPMIISILLAICSVGLFIKAIKDGARFDFITKENIKKFVTCREFKVAMTIILMLALYLFVMLTFVEDAIKSVFSAMNAAAWVRYYVPYAIVTFIYLASFMIIFNEKTKKKIVLSIIISFIASALIAYLFGEVAMILLP